jgi:hypothetical protein
LLGITPMPTDGLPAPDPAIQAEIDYLRRGSYDLLPRPKAITLGVLRYYLSVLECPEPDPAKSPDAFREYRRILLLVNAIPDIRELARWCNCVLGDHLTVAATLAIRNRLSQNMRRSFSDIDGLRIADVVTLLGKLPRPDPLPGEPARTELDGEPWDRWVFDGPPIDPSPSVGSDRPSERTEAAEQQARQPEGEPAADPAAPKPKRPGKVRRSKKSPCPTTLKELAAAIRRDHPRQRRVPRFLDLIADNDEVSYEEVAEIVHEAIVEDETIEKTIANARKAIIGARLPLALVVSDRRVSKKPIP